MELYDKGSKVRKYLNPNFHDMSKMEAFQTFIFQQSKIKVLGIQPETTNFEIKVGTFLTNRQFCQIL